MSLAKGICTFCRLLIVPRPLSAAPKRSSSTSTNSNTWTQEQEEVDKFNRLSSVWWTDPQDPLFLMNQVRIPLVQQLASQIQTDSPSPSILDVGCGGGYLSEGLAKQGFTVLGVDPSPDMVELANNHLAEEGGELPVRYECGTVGEVTSQYDIVVSSEVVEHVPCVETFVKECSLRVKPGGGLMFTTINRTLQSWVFGILLAEHLTSLVPPGTHEYHKFVPPAVLSGIMADCDFDVVRKVGLNYNPLRKQWSISSDLSINYAIYGIKTDND